MNTPLEPRDHPELDDSEFIGEELKRKYWSLIGMLQWAVTLGRMDIHCAVMSMGRYRMQPRIGHLKRLERIFGFLRNYKAASIKFRTELPDYSMYKEVKHDWKYIYGDVTEELPKDMLKPKGKKVIISVFCDANLYFDQVTGHAITGIIPMLNKTPIDSTSKRQATVETATYGSELVAARMATNQVVEWHYVLRMLGVQMDGPSYLFGDNQAVVNSAVIPEYNLKKRHNALCYHRVREAVAAGIIQCYHIDGKSNPADVLTKFLPHAVWWPLMKPFLHWMNEEKEDEKNGKKHHTNPKKNKKKKKKN